jgi:hypothetical protein
MTSYGSLPPFEYSIVIGLILSDGHLQKGKLSKNARLIFSQSTKHIKLALWIYSILAHYCQSFPSLTSTPLNGKEFYKLRLETRSCPCFTLLHSAWYWNGVKVLPPTIFEDLTPVTLAVWAQGKGMDTRINLALF